MKRLITLAIIATLFVTSCGADNSNNENNDVVENSESESNDKSQSEEETINPKFYTLDGEVVDLASFKGKPLVLNLWASWCPPCKAELPTFEEMYKVYGEDVEFAFVSLVGGRETVESAMNFINQNEYDLPFYLDNDQQIAYAFRVTSIPVTYFINSDGTENKKHIGLITENELENQIESLIENNK